MFHVEHSPDVFENEKAKMFHVEHFCLFKSTEKREI